MVFTDRVIAALVILRFQLPHAALAVLYGRTAARSPGPSTRSARSWLPVASPCQAVPTCGFARWRMSSAMPRLRASSCGWMVRTSGCAVRGAGKPGRRAFVSGKMRQNTKKTTVVTDEKGRTLWAGAFRPGRMHDQTAVKTEGICDLFERYSQVKAKVDAGDRGLAKRFGSSIQVGVLGRCRAFRCPGREPAPSASEPPSGYDVAALRSLRDRHHEPRNQTATTDPDVTAVFSQPR